MFPMETLLKPACSWQHVAGNVMPLWRAAKVKASAGQQPNSTPHRNAWLGLAAPPRFSLAIPRENGSARARVLQPPCRTPENYSAHFSKSSSPANTQRVANLKFTFSTLQISQDVQAHEEGRHLRQGKLSHFFPDFP
jgi:hypothetical protein